MQVSGCGCQSRWRDINLALCFGASLEVSWLELVSLWPQVTQILYLGGGCCVERGGGEVRLLGLVTYLHPSIHSHAYMHNTDTTHKTPVFHLVFLFFLHPHSSPYGLLILCCIAPQNCKSNLSLLFTHSFIATVNTVAYCCCSNYRSYYPCSFCHCHISVVVFVATVLFN